MKKYLLILPFCFFLSCGIIQGSKYPIANAAIEAINSSFPPDSPIEEFTENVIEDLTGLEIDFSPTDK